MSDPTSAAVAEPRHTDAGPDEYNGLNYLLAGLMAGAGAIHFAMVAAHAGGESMLDPIGFAVAGWFQFTIAGLLISRRANTQVYVATVVGNAVLVGLWIWSRTSGLPVGSHAGVAEEAGTIDQMSAALEVTAIVLAGVLAWVPGKVRLPVVGSAIAGVAVLGLATSVIVSPEAASHGGHDHGATAAGADHHDTAGAVTEMTLVDQTRCDLALNPKAYWEEAAALGVDTYTGGNMSSDHHASTSMLSQLAPADPTQGRGSPTLDGLVVATEKAGGGEAAAAGLIVGLSAASDEDYDAWLNWLKTTGAVGHEHDAAAPGDAGGHGGHVGPQQWTAMVDQEQCDTLEAEIALSRETALKYPTAADATAAGWRMVTPYVPGIAAHYMKFSIVDGTFDIDEPEMILYDGNSPESAVVGLSYYIVQDGTNEPTQGFTGSNDHYHRHVGLCTVNGLVVGDSTTTKEDCAARGGTKNDGSKGWMSHAWVVPGCESPWGVFSAASPLLDKTLADNSTKSDGCAASGVRERYDLSPGARTVSVSTALDGGSTETAEGGG
jgi:hypothetical protein